MSCCSSSVQWSTSCHCTHPFSVCVSSFIISCVSPQLALHWKYRAASSPRGPVSILFMSQLHICLFVHLILPSWKLLICSQFLDITYLKACYISTKPKCKTSWERLKQIHGDFLNFLFLFCNHFCLSKTGFCYAVHTGLGLTAVPFLLRLSSAGWQIWGTASSLFIPGVSELFSLVYKICFAIHWLKDFCSTLNSWLW